MINQRPTVLIMTATITPPIGCLDLVRSDPQIRLNDYCEALQFYLTIPSEYIDRIIFIDNSDSDLERLRKVERGFVHNKTVEFISFQGGNNFPPEYGKGYGEMIMLNYALDNSKIINNKDIFWKATGRLILLNIETLIEKAPHPYEIYCDLHNSFKILSLEYFFDPRFYSFNMKGYNKYFRVEHDELKYAHIEHLFFHKIRNGIPTGKIVPRFKRQPIILGYVASKNKNYFTWEKKLQRQAQQLIRYVAPWVWL